MIGTKCKHNVEGRIINQILSTSNMKILKNIAMELMEISPFM